MGPDKSKKKTDFSIFDKNQAETGLTTLDMEIWRELTSTELTDEEIKKAKTPTLIKPEQKEVMALHWHPEWVPLKLIKTRIKKAFPQAESVLAIPTQHNRLLALGPWAGVEVDCYAPEYKQKIQLLIHGEAKKLAESGTFIGMLDKTFHYRATQLFEIMHSLTEEVFEERRLKAAAKTGASLSEINLARFYAARLFKIIEQSDLSRGGQDQLLKNRLLSDYIAAQSRRHQKKLIKGSLNFIKAVKKEVKLAFGHHHFHSAREIIEEARSLNCGLVIPHPQLFWAALLANLEVDGWEIWNPSVPDYSPFLLEALNFQNKGRRKNKRLLVFMGDDTHLSAKIKTIYGQEEGQENREIGWQPPWENQGLKTRLTELGYSRGQTIESYLERLS